jgi:hypothetical protein
MNPGLRAVEGPAPKAFFRTRDAIIGSRYSDQPVVQTGQSRLHNFKDNEHARALWVLTHVRNTDIPSRTLAYVWLAAFLASRAKAGGADRDRTDDLKLAKLALSQLSYGPREKDRSIDDGQRRLACQA